MEFTEQYLQKNSVISLRELGRECGVKSPTSLNKKQLIQAILKIQRGEIEPYFNTCKRGRPILSAERLSEQNKVKNTIKLQKIKRLVDEFRKQIEEIIIE